MSADNKNKRAKGQGSIYQRADGRWVGSIDLPRGPDGKRRRKAVMATTEGGVKKKIKEALIEREREKKASLAPAKASRDPCPCCGRSCACKPTGPVSPTHGHP